MPEYQQFAQLNDDDKCRAQMIRDLWVFEHIRNPENEGKKFNIMIVVDEEAGESREEGKLTAYFDTLVGAKCALMLLDKTGHIYQMFLECFKSAKTDDIKNKRFYFSFNNGEDWNMEINGKKYNWEQGTQFGFWME
tara:strand:+ start:79 stop:486 length:408 start_codon:yes stop_codon:yes gene_type:complete